MNPFHPAALELWTASVTPGRGPSLEGGPLPQPSAPGGRPQSLRILPMTAAHLPQVAALEQVCFPADPWSETLFREALDNPAVAILLAEDEGDKVLGYAVLSVILDEGNLDNIAVAPEARRRGVADALLNTLTGFGREHLAALMLEVRASNAPAIALYEKHGFAAVGRRKNYYNAPKEDAVLMTLTF